MAVLCTKNKTRVKQIFSILLLLSFLFGSFGFNTNIAHATDAWWDTSYGYRTKITVNAGQATTTQNYFPVYVNLANMSVGFWSHVKPGGGDIRVTNSLGAELAREVVTISTASSTGELWFKANSIADGSYYYIYYGNTGANEPAATDADGSQKVWDDGGGSNYKGVWHLKETATGPYNDSTAYGNNSNGGSGATQSVGRLGNGVHFSGVSNSSYIKFPDSTSLNINGSVDYTISGWYKNDAVAYPTGDAALFSKWPGAGYMLWFQQNGTGALNVYQDANFVQAPAGSFPADGQWHYISASKSGSNGLIYVDGIQVKNAAFAGSTISSTTGVPADISGYNNEQRGKNVGTYDEVRVSKFARSADWVKTEFNNQKSPSTFYATASEESITVPDAPTGLIPTAGNAQVTLSWNAPANNGGSAITDYAVDFKTTSTTTWSNFGHTPSTATSTIVAGVGLVNGTTYNFRVSAVNAVGQGAASVQATSTPATVPDTPATPSAVSGNAQATVTFSAPANGGSTITGYTVTSSGGGSDSNAGSTTLSHVVTGLTNGTAYTFTVTATNAMGTSASSTASNSVTPATVPNAPTIGTATAGVSQASITFSAPANGGSTITGYTASSSPSGFTGTSSASPITVTGLTAGTSYTFTVTATNAVGTSTASAASNSVFIPTVPDPPTGLTPSAGAGQVGLTWVAPLNNGSSTITDYVIDYKLTASSSAEWSTFADGTSILTTATVTGLTNGSPYNFRVSAKNAVGQGSPSVQATSTPATVPSAPTINTATRGDSQVTVTFSAPNSGGSNILYYTITSNPGSISATTTTTTGVVTGLTNGTPYTFTVTATNAMGNSLPSASSSPVTPATVPSAPLAVSATAGNAQVGLTWSPPSSDGGSAITDYSVDYKFHASSSPSDWQTFSHTPSTATSTTIVGLTNGSQYDFRVSAVNDVNKGSPSDPPVTSTPITVPNAPTGVTATRGNASATVTFSAPLDTGGAPITGYSVTSIPAGGIDSNSGSTTLSHVVTNLVNGTAYTFTVVASNLAGPSVSSSPSSPAVTPATVPNAPTLPSAVRGNAQATVSFTAPADNGSSITSYVVTSNPDGRTGTGSASPVTVSGLTNGTPYTFSVVAINDVGPSSPSVSTVAVTPMTVPGAPTIGTTTPSNTQVSVEFIPPVSDGGSTITSYTASSSLGNFSGTGSGSPIVVSGLTNGTHYTFTVTATNEVGTGPASSASLTATPFTIPDPPTGLTPTAGAGQVGLTWVAPAINGGADITDYVIDYKFTASTSPSDWMTFAHAASTATTFTVTGLSNGVSYDFRVSAKNAAGPGSASGIATAMPVTVPDAPTLVSVVPDNAQATVTFNAPAFNGGNTITGYTVTSNPGNFTASGSASPLTVTGLTNGTSYTFVVTASNALGVGAPSASSSPVIPVTVPGAPTGVSAVEGNTLATVSFTAPDSGGSTILDYTITSSPGNISTTTTGTTGVVTGLTNGTTYTFTVTARNAVGSGSVSAPSNQVKLSTEPDAPGNLAAVVYGSSIGLTWTAPASDGGAAITDYVVEFQLTTGGTWSAFADGETASTSATVVGLSNRTSYDFRVRAKNIIGPSLPSNVVTATPGEPAQVRIIGFPDLTAPSVATEILITNEGLVDYEYQYTWCVTDSETNLCGGGDDVYVETAGKLIESHKDFDTNATSTVLTPGDYWFHVKVLYGSQSTTADRPFTVVATYPDAPTSVVATAGNAQASVSFVAPASNGGSTITGYTVTSNPGGLTGTGSASPIVVAGLTNGTTYTFTVTATNAIGTGPVSSPPSNSVMPVTVPDAPTGVSAAAGDGQVALSWTAPLITGGLPITNYIVEYKLSSEPTAWTLFGNTISTITNTTITSLINNLSYDFRVSAVNDFGRSVVNSTSATLAGNVTPPAPPQGGTSHGGGGSRIYQPAPAITPNPVTEVTNVSPVTEVVPPTKTNKPSSGGVSTVVSPTVPKNEVSATPVENPVTTTLSTSPVSPIVKENNKGSKIPWVPIAGFAGVVLGGGFIYFVLRRRRGVDADR